MRNVLMGAIGLFALASNAHSASQVSKFGPEDYDLCQRDCMATTLPAVDRVAYSLLGLNKWEAKWAKYDAERLYDELRHPSGRYTKTYDAFVSFLMECQKDCDKKISASLTKADQLEIIAMQSIFQSTKTDKFRQLVAWRIDIVLDRELKKLDL